MKEIALIKCHGSGNDFILIDEINNIAIAEEHKPTISQALCDRHLSFGADGVLYVSSSETADCTMRMFNPDGSESQMCGNGLRCVARYYNEYYSHTDTVTVATARTVLQCQQDGNEKGVILYQTEIGPVNLDPGTLPAKQDQTIEHQVIPQLDPSLGWHGLSITNPHIVAFTSTPKKYNLEHIGKTANSLDLFPEGVNCSLISMQGDNSLFVETYERGAGLTNACGTAMAASCFIAAWTGLVQAKTRVTIRNPGGKVYAKAPEKPGAMVLLSGNATFVYRNRCLYDPNKGQLAGEIGSYSQLTESM